MASGRVLIIEDDPETSDIVIEELVLWQQAPLAKVDRPAQSMPLMRAVLDRSHATVTVRSRSIERYLQRSMSMVVIDFSQTRSDLTVPSAA